MHSSFDPPSKPQSGKVVIALHGFLGRTHDWNLIANLLAPGWTLLPIDLWENGATENFETFAARLNERLRAELPPHSSKVLLGYSLGGRLAMHALLDEPGLFKGAVIVSANPGLVSVEDRELRAKSDEVWAEKFLSESWERLLSDWNSQAALRAPKSPAPDAITLSRDESDFSRGTLAQSLRSWSLAKQIDLRAELSKLKLPIEFVTGEDDRKFTALARELLTADGPRSHVVVAHAGHRVPWDAPAQFRAILAKFLSRW